MRAAPRPGAAASLSSIGGMMRAAPRPGAAASLSSIGGMMRAAPRPGAAASLSSVGGMLRGAPGVMRAAPKGVDLNLDEFNLSEATKVMNEATAAGWGVKSCLSPDAASQVIGQAFWENLDSSNSTFEEEDKVMLKALFNPKLSDRREEGDRFVPPDTGYSYVEKLRGLLKEEETLQRQRRDSFLSTEFKMDEAGALFPASWTSSIKVGVSMERHPLQPRPDYKAASSLLESVLQTCIPVFDKATEDGVTFRIYRCGSLEVRTLQEINGNESIGAVFSVSEEVHRVGEGWTGKVSGTDRIVKVTQYVEKLDAGRGYFVVLETEEGAKLVTEKLPDMKVVLEESPASLCDRISLARVVRSADCSTALVDVESMRIYQALESRFSANFGHGCASQSKCKRYAQSAFSRAAGEVPLLQ